MGDHYRQSEQPSSAHQYPTVEPQTARDSDSGRLSGWNIPPDNITSANISNINSTYERVDVPSSGRNTSVPPRRPPRTQYGRPVESEGAAHIRTITGRMVHDSGNRRVHTTASEEGESLSSISDLIHSLESMEQKSIPSVTDESGFGLYGRGEDQISIAPVGQLTASISDMKMYPLQQPQPYVNMTPYVDRPKHRSRKSPSIAEESDHLTLTGGFDTVEQPHTKQPDPPPRISKHGGSSRGYSSMSDRRTWGATPTPAAHVPYQSSISNPDGSQHDSGIMGRVVNDMKIPHSTSAAEPKRMLTQVPPGQDARPKEPRIRTSQSTQSMRPTSTPSPAPHLGKTHSLPAIAKSGNVDEEEADKQYRILFQRASLHEKNNKLEDALADYQMALYFEMEAKGESDISVAKTQRVLGRVCRKLENYQSSITHLERAIEICKQCSHAVDSDIMWNTHDELAQAYSHVDCVKEVKNYERAIEILTHSTDVPPERLAHMHNNVGVSYHNQQNYEKAKEHLLQAKHMMGLMLADQMETAKVHKSLGDLYVETRDSGNAVTEFNACLDILKRNSRRDTGLDLLLPVHTSLAEIYESRGDMVNARKHRQAASNAAGQADNTDTTKTLADSTNQAGSAEAAKAVKASQKDVDIAQQFQAEEDLLNCIRHYEKAKKILEALPLEAQNTESVMHQIAVVYNNLGNAYRSVSRIEDAKLLVEKALSMRRFLYANEACEQTATSLFNLGYIYSQIPGVPSAVQAITYHKQALDMYTQLGGAKKYAKWMVGLHRSIASNQYSVGEVTGSIEHYEQAKTIINEQGGDLGQLQAICNNVGNSYKSLKNYEKAEANFLMSLDLAKMLSEDDPNNPIKANDIATCENNIGCMYQETEQYQKAIQHQTNSLRIREQISHQHGEAITDIPSSLHNLANAHFSAGAYNDALELYKREERMRRDLGDDPREALLSMSRLYDRMGLLDEATECLNRAS